MVLMFGVNLCDRLKKIMTPSGEDSFALTIKGDTIFIGDEMIQLLNICQKIKLTAAILTGICKVRNMC